MLQAGAAAYVSKEDGPEEVFRAMRAVHAGPVALSPGVAADIATRLLDESNRVETLETTIAEISDQLQTMTTAKADFLANVSHELRTPVTVAKGIAYVLKNRGIPKDEEDEFIGQLEASLEKLSMLIEEMLIVADLDRGHALARALAGRPRAAPSPGGRRERATVPRDHDRTRDQRDPPRVGRPDAVHRDRPPAPRQRVSLLPRGPAGRS